MHNASVEESLDSLGTWLPVLLSDTFLLERALVDGDDDDAREQKLGQQSAHPDSLGIKAHVVVLNLSRVCDSITHLKILSQYLPELAH